MYIHKDINLINYIKFVGQIVGFVCLLITYLSQQKSIAKIMNKSFSVSPRKLKLMIWKEIDSLLLLTNHSYKFRVYCKNMTVMSGECCRVESIRIETNRKPQNKQIHKTQFSFTFIFISFFFLFFFSLLVL